jgi:hypothetical protein
MTKEDLEGGSEQWLVMTKALQKQTANDGGYDRRWRRASEDAW